MKHKERAGSRFFTDIDFPDQLYGVLVRSSIERGHLVDIRPPAMPDGYRLYTATDIPGDNRLNVMGTSVPIFTPYEIQYFGEPLGILVGPDLQTVHELVAEVLIETERLTPLSFQEKFTASQVVAKRIIFSGDSDLAFKKIGKVTETKSEIGPQDHYYSEPLGVAVNVSHEGLDIFCATQWPFHVRATVSACLDLDPAEIVVHPTKQGETMDGKIWFPSLIAAQVSLAAVLSKKPVKLVFSRQEDFLFPGKSAPVKIMYRTAIDESGQLAALYARILINAGAYSPLIDEIIDRMTIAALGPYTCPDYRIEAYALRSNLPPMGAMAGWGEAQVFFALETHVADTITALGASPIEWKMLNSLQKGRITLTGSTLNDDSRHDELFDAVCAQSDFPRKHAAYEIVNRRRASFHDGPLRGIGIVSGYQGNGFTGKIPPSGGYSVSVTMETDGKVRIMAGHQSESMARILSVMASVIFGIDRSQISFVGDTTRELLPSGPDTLSTKLTILAPLVEKCCVAIQKQRFRQPLPITVKRSWKASKTDAWDSELLQGTPFISSTQAVCAVETEINPLTWEPTIRGIWIACDAGKILDKDAALTAVRKASAQAISRVTAEYIIVKDGRFFPKNSVQYDVLPPSQASELHVTFLSSEDDPRGIGSLAHNLIPAAFAVSISQILRTKVPAIPIDAELLYDLARETEDKRDNPL
jgi:CO/xanthine dehydrogenase Mo-binding subunit